MKLIRKHRFPPLSQLPLRATQESGMAGMPDKSSADAYRQVLDRGYQEGFKEGYEMGLQSGCADGRNAGFGEGVKEARAHFDSLSQPVEAVLEALTQLQADYQSALRTEVVDLVAKVARQVIRCELALQPTQVLALVDEALEAMPASSGDIEVFLNPEELQRIRELAPERAGRWTLIADGRLEPGECRVKAGDREADAGCRQRLAACIDTIRVQLGEPAPVNDEVAA